MRRRRRNQSAAGSSPVPPESAQGGVQARHHSSQLVADFTQVRERIPTRKKTYCIRAWYETLQPGKTAPKKKSTPNTRKKLEHWTQERGLQETSNKYADLPRRQDSDRACVITAAEERFKHSRAGPRPSKPGSVQYEKSHKSVAEVDIIHHK